MVEKVETLAPFFDQEVSDLAANDGELFAVGSFDGAVVIDGLKLGSRGGFDSFLVQLGAIGGDSSTVTQRLHIGGSGDEQLRAVAVGSDGQVIIAGTYTATFDLFTSKLSSPDETDVFVAKLDPTTSVLSWQQRIGGSGLQQVTDLAVDDDGNVVVVGYFDTQLAVDGLGAVLANQQPGATGHDGFVVKLGKSSGKALWHATVSSSTDDRIWAVQATAGTVFATGGHGNMVTFSSSATTAIQTSSAKSTDAFLAEWPSDGGLNGDKPPTLTNIGGLGEQVGRGLEIISDSVLLAGEFTRLPDMLDHFLMDVGEDYGTTSQVFFVNLDDPKDGRQHDGSAVMFAEELTMAAMTRDDGGNVVLTGELLGDGRLVWRDKKNTAQRIEQTVDGDGERRNFLIATTLAGVPLRGAAFTGAKPTSVVMAAGASEIVWTAGSFSSYGFDGDEALRGDRDDGFLAQFDLGNLTGEAEFAKPAQKQVRRWGGQRVEVPVALTFSSDGGVYAAATLGDEQFVFGLPSVGASGSDAYVSKMFSTSLPAWSQHWTSGEQLTVSDLALGAKGQLLAVGHYRQDASIGGVAAPLPAGALDVFVAEMGKLPQVSGFGSGQDDHGLAVVAKGSMTIVGTKLEEQVDFAGAGVKGLVLLQWVAGEAKQAKSLSDHKSVQLWSMALADSGEVLLTGELKGSQVKIAEHDLAAVETTGFGARCSPQLEQCNAWLLDEADVAVGHAIAAAPNGDAVVVGRLGQDDGFVARYDLEGKQRWLRRLGGTKFQTALDVVVDSHDRAIVGGWFDEALTIGPFTYDSSDGGNDAFIAQYNATGDLLWARQWGDDADQAINRLALGPNGQLAVAGVFEGKIDFEGKPSPSLGPTRDLFVVLISP